MGEQGDPLLNCMFWEQVTLTPMWQEQWFGGVRSAVRLQGPPDRFFADERLPPIWADDADHIARYGGGDEVAQRYLRLGWYIAYLHHSHPGVVLRVLETALRDTHLDVDTLAIYLPELLTHADGRVRGMAAAVTWKCDAASLRHVLTALSSTGAIPSGFSPASVELAVRSLMEACPPERKHLFLSLMKELTR